MPLTLKDFPQDAEERRVFDEGYSTGREWVMVAAMLLPAVPFFPIWSPMRDTLGPEGAALIVIAAQFVSILTVPDWVMAKRAHRALAAFRKSRPVPIEEAHPSPSSEPWDNGRRYDLRGGFTLWLDDLQGKAWARNAGLTPTMAEPADVRKYFAVLQVILDDRAYLGSASAMAYELQLLLAKVILNHRREGEFFRDNPAPTIAGRLHSYSQERADRQVKNSG